MKFSVTVISTDWLFSNRDFYTLPMHCNFSQVIMFSGHPMSGSCHLVPSGGPEEYPRSKLFFMIFALQFFICCSGNKRFHHISQWKSIKSFFFSEQIRSIQCFWPPPAMKSNGCSLISKWHVSNLVLYVAGISQGTGDSSDTASITSRSTTASVSSNNTPPQQRKAKTFSLSTSQYGSKGMVAVKGNTQKPLLGGDQKPLLGGDQKPLLGGDQKPLLGGDRC